MNRQQDEAERNALITGQAFLANTVATVLDEQAALVNAFMKLQGFWESENTGEKIALMHSELSEALEADRKNLPSEHIEGFSGVEEELADCVIRILDFASHHDLRLGEAVVAKMQFNFTRPHKHGKRY